MHDQLAFLLASGRFSSGIHTLDLMLAWLADLGCFDVRVASGAVTLVCANRWQKPRHIPC